MPTLFFRFPGGRYHATPWGHHVNEGQVEWPPSPWRLLRALLATGYATLDWPSDGPPGVACGLIEKLAGVLPRYGLPRAAGAHSRHYMPLARFKNGREETTLVFDTWAQVGEAALAVTWDVPLTEEETALLAKLAERMGYLGRSESWVLARLAMPGEKPAADCFPCDETALPGQGWEQVPLLAPVDSTGYLSWRDKQVAQAKAGLPELPPEPPPIVPPTGKKAESELKKLEKQRDKLLKSREEIGQKHRLAEDPYPADILACLQVTTDGLRKHGWSQPPGSRRVFYWRRADALEVGAPRPKPIRRAALPVEAMLLAMATPSRNDHALPNITRTLPQAERLHAQLVGYLGGGHHAALTGCGLDRRPLNEPHIHAHILPLDLDGDGHLDHLLIWAPMGLDAEAQAAVRAVRQTYAKGGVGPIKLALVGSGRLADLAIRLPKPVGADNHLLRAMVGYPSGSDTWRSLTPFVPPRYLKPSGSNSLEGQVAAELASRGQPLPVSIKRIDPRDTDEALHMRHFIRQRRNGPIAPIDCGFALELRFDSLVRGPICLGYGSHFGMGIFVSNPT